MRAIILVMERDFIFDEDRPLALVKVCGIPLIARILNSVRAVGIREVLIVLGFKGEEIRKLLKNGEELGLKLAYLQAGDHEAPRLREFMDDDLLIINGDIVIDTEFLSGIIAMKSNVACYLNNKSIGVYRLDREYSRLLQNDAASNLDKILEEIEVKIPRIDVAKMEMEHVELKRRISPVCVKIDSRNAIELARRKLVFRTQKGLHFTSYINKPVEDWVIYHIADVSWITPNRMTMLTNLLAFIVAALFLLGYMRIAAVLAYMVGILDGLDGKLARARGILTKLGYIEHTFDMLYEQTWYVCFALSLCFLENSHLPLILGLCMLLADGFVRHCYMQFKETMGKALTAYTNFDRAFARVDGRRNAYVLYMILFSFLDKPLYAMYAMLIHSSITAIVYAIRAIRHMSAADKAEGLKGFLKLVRTINQELVLK